MTTARSRRRVSLTFATLAGERPVDGLRALCGERGVGAAERTRTEEPARGRQRTRVRRLDPRDVAQPRGEALRVAPPQDRDERTAALDERLDRAVGDGLPAASAMARGLAGPHGQAAVE